MDFKQLKTFVTICDLKSFTAAANSLGYAQSTITTQIKILEEDLGILLFDRIGKSISLTYEGEKLLPYAKQMLQLEREVYNSVHPSNQICGNLVIGTPESLCNSIVPQIINIYKKKYPNVNIEIKLSTSKKMPEMIKQNEIDLAFIIGNPHKQTGFETITISKEKMCFLVSPDHPLAHSKKLSLDEIFEYSLILTSKDCEYRSALLHASEQRNLLPHVALETSNINAIKSFTANNLGIAFLPYIAVEDYIVSGHLIEIDYQGVSFDITSGLIYHKDKTVFQAMSSFIETVKEYPFR